MVSQKEIILAVLGCHERKQPSLAETAEILSQLQNFSTYGGAWFSIAWRIRLGGVPGFTAVYVKERDFDGGRRMKIIKTS